MAITTKQVIYLGTFADADTGEASNALENPGIYVGTFGSVGAPLSGGIEDLTFDDEDNNGTIETDNTATSDSTSGLGGVSQVDSLVVVNATVTYADGSTAAFGNVVMFQTTNGELFLANSNFAGTDLRDPDGEDIQSVTINNISGSEYDGLIQNAFQNFTCFLAGTQIATPQGERAIEGLKVGDLVNTLDHGAQPIRWIGQSTVIGGGAMAPVRIGKGALGDGVPKVDLLVSQQHRIMMRSPIAARITGQSDALVAAKSLVALDGIDIIPQVAPVTYHHFLFDHHEVVAAQGAPVESLWPGPQALKMLGPLNRRAVERLIGPHFGPPARPILSGERLRHVLERHRKNDKPVLAAMSRAASVRLCQSA